MRSNILRFYLDILLCKINDIMKNKIVFKINSDTYEIKILSKFKPIYERYYMIVEDKIRMK